MDASQLFDGIAFSSQIGPVVLLDCLPPCACGTPSDDALLRAVFALLDGGFTGVCELKGNEPSTATRLVLAYSDLRSSRPLWLSIDLDSIEGMAVMALLQEIISGTTRTDRDLAAHAIHVVEVAYAHAGRSEEFYAAAQRAMEMQRQAGAKQ
jgi:hypothetical protein